MLETEAATAAMPSVDELIKQLYADMNTELPSWIGDTDKDKKKEKDVVTAPTGEVTRKKGKKKEKRKKKEKGKKKEKAVLIAPTGEVTPKRKKPRRVAVTCVSSTVTGESLEENLPQQEPSTGISEKEKTRLQSLVTILVVQLHPSAVTIVTVTP